MQIKLPEVINGTVQDKTIDVTPEQVEALKTLGVLKGTQIRYDYYYMMSDDPRSYAEGSQIEAEILKILHE